jgi:Fe-S oxidoreductase/coenzyme F420-reducing hydrogenase delta subunit
MHFLKRGVGKMVATSQSATSAGEQFEPTIVAFCCNWCSYAGADLAGVSRFQYPPNVRIIRVMCSGRVDPGFVLQAFEKGADGVLVTGCHIGDCHYISGNEKAERQMDKTKKILELLGLDNRFRLEWVSASEGKRFSELITEFVDKIKKAGPSPFTGKAAGRGAVLTITEINKRINESVLGNKVYHCLECGKCAAVCPITRINDDFSPLSIVERTLRNLSDQLKHDTTMWDCLTCARCSSKCPSDVDFIGFVRDIRDLQQESLAVIAHGGAFQTLQRLMANPELKQIDRTTLLAPDVKTADSGDVLFWMGCLPHIDGYLPEFEMNVMEVPDSAIRILNQADITPIVMKDERCCGHDLLWTGDVDSFKKLVELNIRAIEATGAKTVVTACAEGYRTLKVDYPEYASTPLKFEVKHITEVVGELIDQGKIKLEDAKGLGGTFTFQDPCRMGNHLGVYDPPRKILENLPGIEFKEMDNSRENSICCGTSCFVNCGRDSKRTQMNRLTEAKSAGAETMVTACPKCRMHFTCTLLEPTKPASIQNLKVEDLTVLLARAMGLGKSGK